MVISIKHTIRFPAPPPPDAFNLVSHGAVWVYAGAAFGDISQSTTFKSNKHRRFSSTTLLGLV